MAARHGLPREVDDETDLRRDADGPEHERSHSVRGGRPAMLGLRVGLGNPAAEPHAHRCNRIERPEEGANRPLVHRVGRSNLEASTPYAHSSRKDERHRIC